MLITGIDLVDAFAARSTLNLDLIEASVSSWEPDRQFDVITSVHGLHYVGDKLGLVTRCISWLKPTGLFAASFDAAGVLVEGWSSARIASVLTEAGLEYDARRKLLRGKGHALRSLPFRYLGADAEAGPNYTGQPAVGSHYAMQVGLGDEVKSLLARVIADKDDPRP